MEDAKSFATIKFANPVFQSGVQITVRNGRKWLLRLTPGDEILLAGLDGENEQEATVLFTYCSKFKDLPEALLKLEHDPACRKIMDLFKVMTQLYDDFSPDNVVTVVAFDI